MHCKTRRALGEHTLTPPPPLFKYTSPPLKQSHTSECVCKGIRTVPVLQMKPLIFPDINNDNDTDYFVTYSHSISPAITSKLCCCCDLLNVCRFIQSGVQRCGSYKQGGRRKTGVFFWSITRVCPGICSFGRTGR